MYIEKYKTYEKDTGYNYIRNNGIACNSESSRTKKSIAHTGLKESSTTKRKKSNLIIAIKDNELMFCDSGKLFGDYVGVKKDMVKNGLRQPTRVKEYRLYYADYEKRQEIRKKMLKKKCIRDKEYMMILDVLDKIEEEGVETIYDHFKKAYILSYDDDLKYRLEDYAIVKKPEPETDDWESDDCFYQQG